MSAYVSNSTEGDVWMADNCERCARDHNCHDDNPDADYNGCEVALGLIAGLEPLEGLVVQPGHYMPARLKCTYWKPCTDCGVNPTDVPTSWKVES